MSGNRVAFRPPHQENKVKISARNAFPGTISALTEGTVSAEVEIALAGGDRLIATVTLGSLRELELGVGRAVIAYAKAPWVILVTGAAGIRFSARNQLSGRISALKRGTVNSEVALTLPGGNVVYSVITNDAVDELGLAVGGEATALIKAGSLILAVDEAAVAA